MEEVSAPSGHESRDETDHKDDGVPSAIQVSAYALASECQVFVNAMAKLVECSQNILDHKTQLVNVVESVANEDQHNAGNAQFRKDLLDNASISEKNIESLFSLAQNIIGDPTDIEKQEQLRVVSRSLVDSLRTILSVKKERKDEDELLETAEMVQMAVSKLISSLHGSQEEVVQCVRSVTSACRRLFSPGSATLVDIAHEGLKAEWGEKVENVQKAAVRLLKIVREAQLRPNDEEIWETVEDCVVEPVKEFVSLAKQIANQRLAEKEMKVSMKALRDSAGSVPDALGENIREDIYGSVQKLSLSCADMVSATMTKTYQLLLSAARACTEAMSKLVEGINAFAMEISDQSLFEEIVRNAKALKYSVVRLIASTKAIRSNDRDFAQEVQMAEAAKSIATNSESLVSCIELQRTQYEEKGLGLDANDVNIWDEPPATASTIQYVDDTKDSDTPQIMCGNLNQLIIHLTSRSQDIKYGKAFISTYRSFTTPEALLSKLVQRFINPNWKTDDERKIDTIALRVCNVLNFWLETYFHDFSDELLGRIDNFISGSMEKQGMKLPAKKLRKTIAAKLTEDQVVKSKLVEETQKKMMQPVDIFSYDPEMIARHLTVLDFGIYSAIKPHELLRGHWKKKETHHQAPNVMALINRFNMISLWVANSIIQIEGLKNRSKMVTTIIKIADALRKMNNFHTLQALLSGVSNAAVYRLKFTMGDVPKVQTTNLHKLQDLMSSTSSFSTFRRTLHTVNPPALPYIGVYLTDLTFIEDGNPDSLNDNKLLINFEKRVLLYGVISELQQYQQARYDFTCDPRLLESCENLPTLEDSELYRLSLEREPRNANRSDILK